MEEKKKGKRQKFVLAQSGSPDWTEFEPSLRAVKVAKGIESG
ncbi:hypothetical protein [Mucilaginibacter sp. BT774]|nr:hypothetical protein [Mucilaginibacter sp. BT774]MDO3627995.1 hypothetical protein [Mucilaginibacter sp. BT774]